MKSKKVLSIILLVLLASSGMFTLGCVTPRTTTVLTDEQFTVPARSTQTRYGELKAGDEVRVEITVLQGGNLDIDFQIKDASGRILVSRSRIGQATIDFKADTSGTYYFVFDNSFSLLTAKIVKTRISVTR